MLDERAGLPVRDTVRVELSPSQVHGDFVQRVQSLSGEDLLACYQCGACSAGCPMAEEMDLVPSRVIRLAQAGQQRDVLRCAAIWLCASCYQCGTRCPKGVDYSRIAEALRILAMGTATERCAPDTLPAAVMATAPQQGLVSVLRKYGL
jgi:heterodisulfide reductase subunit C